MENSLKILREKSNESELRVGNHVVLWGGRDLQGEFFTPETEFESDYTKNDAVVVDWEHGFDPDPDSPDSDNLLGKLDWKTATKTDYGLWVERVLDRSKEYMEYIEYLIEEGIIGSSTEAVPSGIRRSNGGEIQVWPIKRDAFTVQPAEPRMRTSNVIAALRSLANYSPAIKSIPGLGELFSEDGQETVSQTVRDDGAIGGKAKNIIPEEENETMNEAPNVITRDEFDEWARSLNEQLASVGGLSEKVNTILEKLANTPAAKKAGLVAPDSEEDNPEVKSFGDFLIAVQMNNVKRLREVYGSVKGSRAGSIKDLGTIDGSAGGFLVPQVYSTEVFEIAYDASAILSRVETVPVGMSSSGTYPALDQYIAPTAGTGQTALAAGLKSLSRTEGGAYTESEPAFAELEWRVREHGGVTEVNNELIRFSPIAVENLLRRLFGVSVAARKEFMVLRGNGTTQYLGILNSLAAVGITPDTNNIFAYPDMLEMWSRFKVIPGSTSGPIWLAHPGMIPDIGVFEIGTDGAGVPSQTGTPGQVGTMPGTPYGIEYSEHLPQDDNSGCVMLADLGAYVIFQSGTLEVAFSEHAAFTTNKGTWRWTDYSDGMPWVKNVITLADPQGSYTVSPFVYLND